MKRVFLILSPYVALCCCLSLFYGCGLFQKTKTSNLRAVMESKEQQVSTAQLNTRDQSLGWSLSAIDDSLNSSSTVVIWPKGEFNFSPSKGFSGMADKVIISGALKSGRKLIEENIHIDEKVETGMMTVTAEKSVTTDQKEMIKERFPISVWWCLLLLVPLFLALKQIRGRL